MNAREAWTGSPQFHNAVEPPRLYEHFVRHPPRGFTAWRMSDGTPAFCAPLDPLLTADAALRRSLARVPGLARVLARVRLRTCFVGTTVSEYAPLAAARAADALATDVLTLAQQFTLTVVKDLPVRSPLLDDASNRHASRVAAALAARGFILVQGQALAWLPVGHGAVAEHLGHLSRGARRDIRRKLRSRAHVSVECLHTGDPVLRDPDFCSVLYRLYRNVYDQSDTHFDLHQPAFLDAVLADASLDGRLFVYRVGGRLIGFNLCFVSGDALVDKYVGFEYPAARQHNLYAVSWIQNLEYAASLGLVRYVAGWTDPAVKAHLGAQFTPTQHAVYARNPVLRTVLRRIAHRVSADRVWLGDA